MSTCKWRLKPGDIIEYTDRLDPSGITRHRIFVRYDKDYPGIAYVNSGVYKAHVYISDLTFSRIIRASK